MIIGSISENKNIEKRVAITPDIIKKYKSLGLEVHLSKGYAVHLESMIKSTSKKAQKFLQLMKLFQVQMQFYK